MEGSHNKIDIENEMNEVDDFLTSNQSLNINQSTMSSDLSLNNSISQNMNLTLEGLDENNIPEFNRRFYDMYNVNPNHEYLDRYLAQKGENKLFQNQFSDKKESMNTSLFSNQESNRIDMSSAGKLENQNSGVESAIMSFFEANATNQEKILNELQSNNLHISKLAAQLEQLINLLINKGKL